ncbi:hypothetical protein KJ564_04760 [bacterium]|nr:hypothetical protein [bacterium]
MKPIVFCALIGMSLLMAGCIVEQPGEPKWEVEFTIPIADRVYSLQELVTDSGEVTIELDYVTVDDDTLFLNFTDSLETIDIEDQITNDPIDDIVLAEVGTRTVNDPGTETSLIEIIEAGYSPFVPPFDFGPKTRPLEDFAEFQWMEVSSGNMTITVTNLLPIDISSLLIKVFNDNQQHLQIIEVEIDELLPAGASVDTTVQLPKYVHILNQLELELTGSSEGSGTPVTFTDENNDLQIDVNINTLYVVAALAHIPAQSFNEDTTYVFEETDSIRTAVIREGSISYAISNSTNLVNDIDLTFPDITNGGEDFTVVHTLQPQSNVSETVDLAGYTFYRENQDNLIRAVVISQTHDTNDPIYPNPGSYVEIDSAQTVEADFTISGLIFSQFEGFLAERELVIEQTPLYLDEIPDGLDSLNVSFANLTLDLTSIIGASIWMDIAFDAYKNGNLAANYTLEGLYLPAGSPESPAHVDSTFSGFEAIVNILPDSIIPSGHATVSGYVNIEEWHWINGDYRFYAPFFFSVNDTTTLEPESSDYTDGFENPVNAVDIEIRIENGLPVNGEAYILVCYDSLQFSNYNPNGEPIDTLLYSEILEPEIGPNGYVQEPAFVMHYTNLTENQIQLFADADENRPLWIKTYIVLNPTPDIVKCIPESYITVGASAHVVVQLGDWDNGGGQ